MSSCTEWYLSYSYPPHSPNLTSNNFRLFLKPEFTLKGRTFANLMTSQGARSRLWKQLCKKNFKKILCNCSIVEKVLGFLRWLFLDNIHMLLQLVILLYRDTLYLCNKEPKTVVFKSWNLWMWFAQCKSQCQAATEKFHFLLSGLSTTQVPKEVQVCENTAKSTTAQL